MKQTLRTTFAFALIIALALSMLPLGAPVQAAATDLFFSEYIEGSSNNKALEIYNATGAAVDLASGGYSIQMFSNGSTSASVTINLTGTVADGDVYVVAQSAAVAEILTQADQTNGAGWYNGNDAVTLRKGTSILDVIGQIGFNPGTEWGSDLTSTADNTLRRKSNICVGDPNGSDTFDPSIEWDGYATNTFDGLGSHTATCGTSVDYAPKVIATSPADSAISVALDANFEITFSEPVNLSGDWFAITCADSGNHTAIVSGGPAIFTLNPDTNFLMGETCTVDILAANVTDQDTDDPPDEMEANVSFSFTSYIPLCGLPYTPIYDIQGSGASAAITGTVTTQGVVVGDFEGASPTLRGFYLQDETGDDNSATSDGIFVYNGSNNSVSPGQVVRVTGNVTEYYGLTEISPVNSIVDCEMISPLAATEISLPVSSTDTFEQYEGMLVTFPQSLVISEYFDYDRYGEIVLSSERHLTPTAEFDPGSPEAMQAMVDITLGRITLDDARTSQNPDPALHPNGAIFDLTNLFRGGDILQNVTGVMDYRNSLYKIQPTQGADYIAYNPRPEQSEEVYGNLKVASFNVLNYFTTLNSRGANTTEEFERQRTKIIAAISQIDADVVGLIEIENNDEAIQDLVSGLNEAMGAGTYAYVDTGIFGTDEIKVAFIYKPAMVSLVNGYAILDSSVDSRFIDDKNRPALAQTFMDNTTGGILTVAVNHFKSKGSDCLDVGDPDLGDGAGNCNLTRTAAAEALVDWLATDPTDSGDADFLIIGDLNSYDKEDPIDAILAGSDDQPGSNDDYTDLIYQFIGEDAYSYVFDGQTGYLDHALASFDLLSEIPATTIWHINADEPDLIDYDMSYKEPAQDLLYAPDPFRSSDHDPVIIGLNICDEIAPTIEVSVSPDTLWAPNHKYVNVKATVIAADNFDPNPTITLLSVTSNEPDDGLGDGDTPDDVVIVNDFTFKLRAERSALGTGRVYTITYQVSDACGNTAVQSATVFVPLNQKP